MKLLWLQIKENLVYLRKNFILFLLFFILCISTISFSFDQLYMNGLYGYNQFTIKDLKNDESQKYLAVYSENEGEGVDDKYIFEKGLGTSLTTAKGNYYSYRNPGLYTGLYLDFKENLIDKSNKYYPDHDNAIFVVDGDNPLPSFFKVAYGSLPKKDNEVALSLSIYETFKKYGYYYHSVDQNPTDILNPEEITPEKLIGKRISKKYIAYERKGLHLYRDYIISGFVDTGGKISDFKILNEEINEGKKTLSPKALDELNSYNRQRAIFNTVFLTSEGRKNLIRDPYYKDNMQTKAPDIYVNETGKGIYYLSRFDDFNYGSDDRGSYSFYRFGTYDRSFDNVIWIDSDQFLDDDEVLASLENVFMALPNNLDFQVFNKELSYDGFQKKYKDYVFNFPSALFDFTISYFAEKNYETAINDNNFNYEDTLIKAKEYGLPIKDESDKKEIFKSYLKMTMPYDFQSKYYESFLSTYKDITEKIGISYLRELIGNKNNISILKVPTYKDPEKISSFKIAGFVCTDSSIFGANMFFTDTNVKKLSEAVPLEKNEPLSNNLYFAKKEDVNLDSLGQMLNRGEIGLYLNSYAGEYELQKITNSNVSTIINSIVLSFGFVFGVLSVWLGYELEKKLFYVFNGKKKDIKSLLILTACVLLIGFVLGMGLAYVYKTIVYLSFGYLAVVVPVSINGLGYLLSIVISFVIVLGVYILYHFKKKTFLPEEQKN